ncbi:hypothetical protein ACNPON_10140, partial [Glutamicibacter sp. AGC13]
MRAPIDALLCRTVKHMPGIGQARARYDQLEEQNGKSSPWPCLRLIRIPRRRKTHFGKNGLRPAASTCQRFQEGAVNKELTHDAIEQGRPA